MAEATAELLNLKLRAAKRQGQDRITLIDHTVDSRVTLTVAEGVKYLANLCEKAAGQHMIHIVDHRAEKKRKQENPSRSTKVIIDTGSPEAWTALQLQKDRYIEIAVDPHLGILLMIRALEAQSEETIKAWLHEGEQESPEPNDSLPEWLR